MLDDFDLDRGDLIPHRVADFRPAAPVERRIGQMKEQIERQGAATVAAEQPVEQFGVFRSDSGQGRDRREERVQESGAHGLL
jgi:hypothetical protein